MILKNTLPNRSVRTKEPPPHEVRSGGSFMSEDALGSYPMRTADNYVALD